MRFTVRAAKGRLHQLKTAAPATLNAIHRAGASTFLGWRRKE
jgi:hypothetical protein